jgi:hypothetical protein
VFGQVAIDDRSRVARGRGPYLRVRTRPYRPRTNGTADRLIQGAPRDWAYVHSYGATAQGINGLPRWLQG